MAFLLPPPSLPILQPRRKTPPVTVTSAATRASNKKPIPNGGYHSTLKALNPRGRRNPRKSLSQHYMLNSGINEQLASVANVGDGDVVLEIGPGTGSLMSVLIDAGVTVVAVEKDPHMTIHMKDRFGCTEQLMVLQEDFVRCDIGSHLSPLLKNKKHMGRGPDYAKVSNSIKCKVSFIIWSHHVMNLKTI